jgi:hypothetical protein
MASVDVDHNSPGISRKCGSQNYFFRVEVEEMIFAPRLREHRGHLEYYKQEQEEDAESSSSNISIISNEYFNTPEGRNTDKLQERTGSFSYINSNVSVSV